MDQHGTAPEEYASNAKLDATSMGALAAFFGMLIADLSAKERSGYAARVKWQATRKPGIADGTARCLVAARVFKTGAVEKYRKSFRKCSGFLAAQPSEGAGWPTRPVRSEA